MSSQTFSARQQKFVVLLFLLPWKSSIYQPIRTSLIMTTFYCYLLHICFQVTKYSFVQNWLKWPNSSLWNTSLITVITPQTITINIPKDGAATTAKARPKTSGGGLGLPPPPGGIKLPPPSAAAASFGGTAAAAAPSSASLGWNCKGFAAFQLRISQRYEIRISPGNAADFAIQPSHSVSFHVEIHGSTITQSIWWCRWL